MKTDDLIQLLAKDSAVQWPFHRVFGVALTIGVAVAATLFCATLGPRPDIVMAMHTPRFWAKFSIVIVVAVAATALSQTSARPAENSARWQGLLLVAPVLPTIAAAIELYVVPPGMWTAKLIGQNARLCLTAIPLLSLGPLVCLFLALRRGAPRHPGAAGAIAGLVSGAIAATLYATHCPDDSPLFVIVWYTISIMAVTVAGYALGHRLLRW